MATRLATAAVTCSLLPSTSTPWRAAGDHGDVLGDGVDRAGVDARPRWPRRWTTGIGASSGSSPCSRDSSMTCWTSRESRSLSISIRSEKRLTASGSSAASCTASASSRIAPTGVFSSWLTLADEVAAYGLDPALAGAVLDQRQHQPGAERRDPGGHVPRRHAGAGHHQLGLADLPVAAYLLDQRRPARRRPAPAADQPHRVRRRGRLEHDVAVVDDDRAAAQDGEDGRDAGGYDGLLGRDRGADAAGGR